MRSPKSGGEGATLEGNEQVEFRQEKRHVTALCGGVGGAKLALGLYSILGPDNLTVVCNTGDDFNHLGLHISPDIDTVTYTLADLNCRVKGWGRRDETWSFMDALGAIGGETWFQLGDRDLALHVERTRRLVAGEPLSEVTQNIARKLGVRANVLPMTDSDVRTEVESADGWLSFQDYFVRHRCEPPVRSIAYRGADSACLAPSAMKALARPDLRAVIVCPSNPLLSIGPMLAIRELSQAAAEVEAPIVGVSPIVSGHSIKGPTEKIFGELGYEMSLRAIHLLYRDIVKAWVVDPADSAEGAALNVPFHCAPCIMSSLEDRISLATATIRFADSLARSE